MSSVEADDVLDLLDELGIVGALEGANAVRLQLMRLRDSSRLGVRMLTSVIGVKSELLASARGSYTPYR
jgi:hypothetical protein